MLAPASKAALLKNPPGAHYPTAEHLNLPAVQAKSVPTFCLKVRFHQTGRAGVVEQPAVVSPYAGNTLWLRSEEAPKCVPGEVHRRGRLRMREQSTQRPSYADFFGSFLVRQQERDIRLLFCDKKSTYISAY